jgi:hypothetical protein
MKHAVHRLLSTGSGSLAQEAVILAILCAAIVAIFSLPF